MKELRAKKTEKESSLQDLDNKFPIKKEDEKIVQKTEEDDTFEKKREETPKKYVTTFKTINESNVQQKEEGRNSRFFKGFNEPGGKTAAHTIRQIVKNKYSQATQPVSVEELKNYAEKLNRLNFESVQKKSKKKISRAYASPNQNSNSKCSYSSQFTNHPPRAADSKHHHNHLQSTKPYGHLQQNQKDLYDALNEAIQMQPRKVSGENSPVKGFSELSSIVIQPNEHSIDQSVDDLLQNSEEKAKKDLVRTQEIQPPIITSPNFHLNIKYLMGTEGQNHKNINAKESLPPPKSMERTGNYQSKKEVSRKKGPRSFNNLDPEHTSPPQQSQLLMQRVVSGPTFIQAKQILADQQRSKDTSPPIQSFRDENSQQKTLYYLNFKREDPQRNPQHGNYFNTSIKNHTMEPEGGSIPDAYGFQFQAKHLRSNSMHPEDGLAPRRYFGVAVDELISQQKSHEVEKKNMNDIMSLDAARGLVRTFRTKLSSLAYAVDNNKLDESSSKEICSLIKDYNENKYLLSNKDHEMLSKLETAIHNIPNNEITTALNRDLTFDQTQKPPRSVSVNMITKHIATSIKDLECKQLDESPYKPYKKSVDFNAFNDSVSSGRGSNHDDKTTTTNSSLGVTKEPSLLYSKGKGNWIPSLGKASNTQTGNTINIYNQFAIQDLKQIR